MLVNQNEKTSFLKAHTKYKWAEPLISELLSRFDSKVGAKHDFPCVFAQNAFQKVLFRFSLVSYNVSSKKYDFSEFRKDLDLYLEKTSNWDGNINTHNPLLVILESSKDV